MNEMSYSTAEQQLKEFVENIPPNTDLNEATTRLRYIDTILRECLNWDVKEIVAEERVVGADTYSDYSFFSPRKVLIVEAKREGKSFELPLTKNTSRIVHKISALMRASDDLASAIKQVSEYCYHNGVQYGAVTNGRQLVAFIASRNDGIAPLEGDALVFDAPESMYKNFRQLWDALSKDGIGKSGLHRVLTAGSGDELPPKLKTELLNYGQPRRRTVAQEDLKVVSELLFEEIMGWKEIEPEFLRACYVQSEHLSNYTLLSKKILESRYSRMGSLGVVVTELATIRGSILEKKNIPALITRRPVLLVGDINVGKTSFIKNLMEVEAKDTLSKSVHVYIDLLTQANFDENLSDFVRREVTDQLRDKYAIDIEERSFVRGVYRVDLKHFGKTIYGDLKGSERFAEEEVNFLQKKIDDPIAHMRESIGHISRDKQVVIFLDNADQRGDMVQEKIFALGQELAERWETKVFISLRPDTLAKLKKDSRLSGYYSKIFTIRPPALEDVVRRRLEFALKLATGELPVGALKNSTIKLDNITKLIRIFLRSMEKSKEIPSCMENIASGDVSVALSMLRDFFHSPLVKQEEIIEYGEKNTNSTIQIHDFLLSVIYRDQQHFDPENSYVSNLLDVIEADEREHFLAPILLATLSESDKPDAYVPLADIYTQAQGIGFNPSQIDAGILRLLDSRLIESFEYGNVKELGNLAKVRITERGAYHVKRLLDDFSYVDAMIVDTPILDDNVRIQLNDPANMTERLNRFEIVLEYLNRAWSKISNAPINVWEDRAKHLAGEVKNIRSRVEKASANRRA